MTEREKVISDLEQCLDDSVAAVVPADTVTEAIALLKAWEPRVLTLGEVQSCENAMWIELLGGKGFYAFVLDRMKNGILEISTRAAYLRYYSKDYDATWRCWTSRPDQATREATPWED